MFFRCFVCINPAEGSKVKRIKNGPRNILLKLNKASEVQKSELVKTSLPGKFFFDFDNLIAVISIGFHLHV